MQRLSQLASTSTPFLFYTNFDASITQVYTLAELENEDIEFSFEQKPYIEHPHFLIKYPLDFQSYEKAFNAIIEKIKSGESYLLNYTCVTPIKTELSLKEIYNFANAAFKLRVKDNFVCFSPERFIKIQDNTIYTYPMKGTIDASIDNAEAKILANAKETAEHIMVVDLLRNDLSMVSKEVRVSKFRYIDKIRAGDKELLQVSSEIQGKLEDNWKESLGEIIQNLLPAGSITGAPKKRTIEIIKDVEIYNRDYFTGIFGYFDGKVFDSAVMIRFISKHEDGLMYQSGGGITLDSNAHSEYQEMQDKIYIP